MKKELKIKEQIEGEFVYFCFDILEKISLLETNIEQEKYNTEVYFHSKKKEFKTYPENKNDEEIYIVKGISKKKIINDFGIKYNKKKQRYEDIENNKNEDEKDFWKNYINYGYLSFFEEEFPHIWEKNKELFLNSYKEEKDTSIDDGGIN